MSLDAEGKDSDKAPTTERMSIHGDYLFAWQPPYLRAYKVAELGQDVNPIGEQRLAGSVKSIAVRTSPDEKTEVYVVRRVGVECYLERLELNGKGLHSVAGWSCRIPCNSGEIAIGEDFIFFVDRAGHLIAVPLDEAEPRKTIVLTAEGPPITFHNPGAPVVTRKPKTKALDGKTVPERDVVHVPLGGQLSVDSAGVSTGKPDSKGELKGTKTNTGKITDETPSSGDDWTHPRPFATFVGKDSTAKSVLVVTAGKTGVALYGVNPNTGELEPIRLYKFRLSRDEESLVTVLGAKVGSGKGDRDWFVDETDSEDRNPAQEWAADSKEEMKNSTQGMNVMEAVVEGSLLAVLTKQGILVLNISDPKKPTLIKKHNVREGYPCEAVRDLGLSNRTLVFREAGAIKTLSIPK